MEIHEIRKQIDEIDDVMLSLFLRRMELSKEIAAYKKSHGLPVADKQREREILAKVSENSGNMEPYACRLFTTLFQLSKACQSELLSEEDRHTL